MGAVLPRLIALATCAASACSSASAPLNHSETPERQFVLDGVRLSERRDGALAWTGTARRADGDLKNVDVEDVTLTRRLAASMQAPVVIQARRARLCFDAGKAHFQVMQATQSDGGKLAAPTADYDERGQILVAQPPVRYTAPRLRLRAAGATLRMEAGQLDLAGPIVGRLGSARVLAER